MKKEEKEMLPVKEEELDKVNGGLDLKGLIGWKEYKFQRGDRVRVFCRPDLGVGTVIDMSYTSKTNVYWVQMDSYIMVAIEDELEFA